MMDDTIATPYSMKTRGDFLKPILWINLDSVEIAKGEYFANDKWLVDTKFSRKFFLKKFHPCSRP
jgi:hypothetical protein